jgi:hypothetical protein
VADVDRRRPRFPGYDVTAQSGTWDEVTRAVVLRRLDPPPPLRFFTAEEGRTARALTDRLLDQDAARRLPVVEVIDGRLADGVGDGYRYADLPEDADAWRRSLMALDDDARAAFGRPFADLDRDGQMDLVEARATDDGEWHGLPAGRVFALWMRYATAAFYAHPVAWSEMGFGGPAYPRGYKNLGLDKREPWERAEVDTTDPVPWAERVESAKRRHAHRTARSAAEAATGGEATAEEPTAEEAGEGVSH